MSDAHDATLTLRLVRRGRPMIRSLDSLSRAPVRMVWHPGEQCWRSERAIFAAAAARTPGAPGAFHAIAHLSDGPVYRVALRLPGEATDSAADLTRRLGAATTIAYPYDWACADCRRRKGRGFICERHQREMPPMVLYRTAIPRVARERDYYLFGLARDWPASADPDHNDRDLAPDELAVPPSAAGTSARGARGGLSPDLLAALAWELRGGGGGLAYDAARLVSGLKRVLLGDDEAPAPEPTLDGLARVVPASDLAIYQGLIESGYALVFADTDEGHVPFVARDPADAHAIIALFDQPSEILDRVETQLAIGELFGFPPSGTEAMMGLRPRSDLFGRDLPADLAPYKDFILARDDPDNVAFLARQRDEIARVCGVVIPPQRRPARRLRRPLAQRTAVAR